MSDEPHDVAEEASEQPSRRRFSAAQKTLVLGLVLVAAFIVGAVVTSALTDDAPTVLSGPDGGGGSLEERVPPGRQVPLPDRRLEGFAGGPDVDLTDYRGRPLVVNFWASWCAPCVKEMPDFERVATEAGDRVAFLGVNVQDAPSNAEAFAEEIGVSYQLATDPAGAFYQEVRGFGMPTTLFVDPDGMIVWRHTGILDEDSLRAAIHDHLGVEI